MIKTCRTCGVEKQIDDYYVHSQMGDGHLNICKECVRKRVSDYAKTPARIAYDKRRNQTPKRKAWTREFCRKQRLKWKKKRKASSKFWAKFKTGAIKKLPCEKCGTEKWVEAHHSDYNKPYEVIWLCSLHHKEWHRNNKAKNER